MARRYGDRWTVEGQLGEGGQAHTFVVRDERAGGDVRYALKRLKNARRLGRFRTEVDILRSLTHPNVINLVDFDLENDSPYFVSELCEGGDLTRYAEHYKDDAIRSLDIFIDISRGVAAAHQAGVIHRDIKPENILFRTPNGPVVVADFGIAYVEDGERRTLTDEAVGARYFIAPELEAGRADVVDARSDVYSLGKLLYWMISGGRRFAREGHRDENYDLSKTSKMLPQERTLLEHVNLLLDKMIAYDPGSRFNSVNDVIYNSENVRYHIQRNHNSLSPNMQICKYCGQGNYVLVVNQEGRGGSIDVTNFGFTPVSGNSPWRIFRCRMCGHLEFFRIDPWWGPR